MSSFSDAHLSIITVEDVQRSTREAEYNLRARNIPRLWSGAGCCPHAPCQYLRTEPQWPPAVLSIRQVAVCVRSDCALKRSHPSGRKHPYYLNGRVLYILFSQVTLASAYLLRTVLLDRFAVRWTQFPSQVRCSLDISHLKTNPRAVRRA